MFGSARSFEAAVCAAGVRVFEYTAGTNHAKIVVADDQWAMVGSANLDYRSMRLNFGDSPTIDSARTTESRRPSKRRRKPSR